MKINTEEKFTFPTNYRNISIVLIVIGLAAAVTAMLLSPGRFWANFLVNNFMLVSLGLFSIFFLAIQYVAKMSWSVPFKKVTEGFTPALLVGGGLMLVTLIGLHSIYEWSHQYVVNIDPVLQHKSVWLNTSAFVSRMVFILALWIAFYWLLRRNAEKAEESGDLGFTKRLGLISALFLPLFALSYSVAGFDWIMSIEPHWFSTIYAVYVFAGFITSGLAFLTLLLIVLRKLGYLEGVVNENHFHDLGKFMFAMSTFWAYIWISQYLLIWYSNIPEETLYYINRANNGWSFLMYFNVVINWVIPFFILLPRSSKRSMKILGIAAILLVIGHWLDLFILIAPQIYHSHNIDGLKVGPLEILLLLGYLGLIVFLAGTKLGMFDSIRVKNDPYLEEGLHLEQ
jgi:hypothetical protein